MAKPTVDAALVPTLARKITAAGGSIPAAVATALSGVEREPPGPSRRIPLQAYLDLFEQAAAQTGDLNLGIHWALELEIKRFGIFGYIVANSPTVSSIVDNVRRYLHLHIEGVEADFQPAGPDMRLVYRLLDPGIRPSRQQAEFTLTLAFKVGRDAGGPGWHPVAVDFAHPEPPDAAEHRQVFGAPVRFGQAQHALVFERALMNRRIPGADSHLLGILEHFAADMLAQRPDRADLIERLERYVARALPNGPPSIAAAARELHMSVRTLQRRLGEHGMVYNQIVDEVRQSLAARYLDEPDLSLSEIAFMLGYSELSAFHRAHRRWTGMSPSARRGA